MRDQMVLLHFPREADFVVHLVQCDDRADGVLEFATDLADAHGLSVLMAERDQNCVLLLPHHPAFVRELTAEFPADQQGTSSTFGDLEQARAALRQAKMSLMTSARRGRLTPFDQVGFVNFILAQVPAETLQEKSSEILAAIGDGSLVEETLIAYLRSGMDIQATARTLHLHPNSIRYRLAKAEDLLDRPLSDPETITLLYLTLHDRLAMTTRVANGSKA